MPTNKPVSAAELKKPKPRPKPPIPRLHPLPSRKNRGSAKATDPKTTPATERRNPMPGQDRRPQGHTCR